MPVLIWIASPSLLAAAPGWSQNKQPELEVIGWNDCSVAVQLGPRVGTIGQSQSEADENWLAEPEGEATEKLIRSGYTAQGTAETVRPEPIAEREGLEELIRKPKSLEPKVPKRVNWPAGRLSKVYYNDSGACALAVFEGKKLEYRFVSIDPKSRRKRSLAHVTNAILLGNSGDDDGALRELSIAADMDPGYAAARYYYALQLARMKNFEEALNQLTAACAADARFAAKAKAAPEFAPLKKDDRFRRL